MHGVAIDDQSVHPSSLSLHPYRRSDDGDVTRAWGMLRLWSTLTLTCALGFLYTGRDRATSAEGMNVAQREGAYLQIGEVAERTGVTQRTLRFYEEKGLLKPPSRMEGGFRLYSEDDVRRVEQIKQLQSLLGLSLAEIKEMVEAEEVKSQIRAEYRRDADAGQKYRQMLAALELTEKQHGIIRQKIEQLQTMSDELEAKINTYRTWLANLEAQIEQVPTASGTA